MDRRIEGVAWVSECGSYWGKIILVGKPPTDTLLLSIESKLRLARENVRRMKQ